MISFLKRQSLRKLLRFSFLKEISKERMLSLEINNGRHLTLNGLAIFRLSRQPELRTATEHPFQSKRSILCNRCLALYKLAYVFRRVTRANSEFMLSPVFFFENVKNRISRRRQPPFRLKSTKIFSHSHNSLLTNTIRIGSIISLFSYLSGCRVEIF